MPTTDPQDELLYVVDEDDNVIRKATRGECHKKGFLHRVATALVLNKKYEIFVSKRSKTKYYCPSHWSLVIGGHVEFGETYEEAIKRELEEELGIIEEPVPLGKYIDKTEDEIEIREVFYAITDKKIKLNKVEFEEGLFMTLEEAEKKIKTNKFIPETPHNLRFLKNLLKQKGIIK